MSSEQRFRITTQLIHDVKARGAGGVRVTGGELEAAVNGLERPPQRIAKRGIPYAPDQRARHERAAVKAEAHFVLRLTGDVEQSSAVLRELERPWWTEEELAQHDLRDFDRLELSGPLAKALRRLIAKRGERD